MEKVFRKTSMLTDKTFHYCPGCTHGIIHAPAEAEELGGATGDRRAPWAAPSSLTNILTATCTRRAHGRASPWRRASSACILMPWSSPTRATTSPPSAWQRSYTRRRVGEDHDHFREQRDLRHDRRRWPHDAGGAEDDDRAGRPPASHCGYPVRVSELLATLGRAYIERVSMHDANVMRAKSDQKAFE